MTDVDNRPIEGEIVREVHLKVSPKYATIDVIPKEDGEKNDTNFPHNLHNAAELFLRVGMVTNAERLKDCTEKMMNLYAENPDGRTGMKIGKASICWSCGHCGIPKDYDEQNNNSVGPCFNCGEMEQINRLKINHKERSCKEIPWIEIPPLTEAESKKKEEAVLAAKRAEIETNIKTALEERASEKNT
mmetsp:Transcript_31145/g.35466  ORF Transcript_31145/g.35466 Transcript_31145/m.35466 type:complete len:188 (+) Transcript_31145:87-650(+)